MTETKHKEKPKVVHSMTLCTIKLPSGAIAIKNAPVFYQGEYFAVEMNPRLAESLWDGQQQVYKIEFNQEDMQPMSALCTHWIKISDTEAKCFFTRHELIIK